MKCLRCQHENAPRMKFCGECGTPLTANPSGPSAPSDAELTSALSEAREQQIATAEILRIISSSPADVQPVFAAVLTSAARLCDAFDAGIFQVEGDGLRLVAHEGPIPSSPVGAFPLQGTAAGRAVLDRRTIHVPDLQAEVDEYPESSVLARSYGYRTTLTVPLLRGAEAIGVIGIRRAEVRPFTDRQIALLETFAAQAVIAIENVRLFNETKRGARATDRHGRDLAGDLQLANRSSAGARRRGRERRSSLWRGRFAHLPPRRRRASGRGHPRGTSAVGGDWGHALRHRGHCLRPCRV